MERSLLGSKTWARPAVNIPVSVTVVPAEKVPIRAAAGPRLELLNTSVEVFTRRQTLT
jgi:hypothetical protein